MTEPPSDGYLMHFEDGPIALRHNVRNAAGTTGNIVVARDLFGWPLPDRLRVLAHEGVENVALWDVEDPVGLPPEIVESPNAVTYRKISESQLPDDSLSMVMRGAAYALEPPQ